MAELKYDKKTGRLMFTKQMKREGYRILMPNMAPIHFRILASVFRSFGYNCELLETTGPEIAQTGLKYVHNDTCYPALLVIGQFINALQSGKYDVHKTALMITQRRSCLRRPAYAALKPDKAIRSKQGRNRGACYALERKNLQPAYRRQRLFA